ncbi:DUF2889 domain-containing protein [Ramlibacter sp. 2FC]|uniref:DUF2889 domain-containing protein n=1 Tax=Ramlibacter sp. 2FC TaxID=2502188 RepID=UPI0010F5EFED|nr:DUF2889 domain-containing protein [Ramlibacter sp. 2FC]
MPLYEPSSRREIHHRVIDMRAYLRDDGLYDVEAHLIDRKPFPFQRPSSPDPIPAGQALHDLWIRMTVDKDYVVQEIAAASDVTPWSLCKQAEDTLSVLVGERIARGWSAKVKERLRGAASCTHLMEMLIPMGTTALQGIRGLNPERVRTIGADGTPTKIDSCFAYGRQREVVKLLWPEHHRPPEGS